MKECICGRTLDGIVFKVHRVSYLDYDMCSICHAKQKEHEDVIRYIGDDYVFEKR
jgi:hypothetical protein